MRLCVVMLGLLFLAGCDKPIITIDLKGQPSIPAQPAPPRFQLIMANSPAPYFFTYLLDTQTGTLWQRNEIVDLEGKPSVWVQQTFVESLAPSSAQNPMSFEMLKILHPSTTKKEEK